MNFKYIKTKRVNETLWVEIHNPPVNFIITDMLEEMHVLIKSLRKDPSIRVFILTGGFEDSYIMHFSIAELTKLSSHLRKIFLHIPVRTRFGTAMLEYFMAFTLWLMDILPFYETLVLKFAKAVRGFSTGPFLWFQMMRTYDAIESMYKVTIAAINGPCNGGGTEMAACFDFRFMVGDQGFTIGQPEVLVNIVPGGGGTQRLPRLIGKARALELMLKGTQLSPQEAKDIGLLTDIFEKKEFYEKVQAFADLMSSRPSVAIGAIKKAVNRGMNTSLKYGLSAELAQSVRCFDTKDTEMALERYLEYINENIMPIDISKMKDGYVLELLHKTIDTVESGRLFR